MHSFKAKILDNIKNHGFHITTVKSSATPRFSYTIGLTQLGLPELIWAGSIFYSHQAVCNLISKLAISCVNKREVSPAPIGFETEVMHISWAKLLALGVFDIYEDEGQLLQLHPLFNATLDSPKASLPWDESTAGPWKWLTKQWDFPVPENSVAVTNIAALQGKTIKIVSRWESDQWQMFAGHNKDVERKDVRVVPLGTMIGIDATLSSAITLEIDKSIKRSPSGDWMPY